MRRIDNIFIFTRKQILLRLQETNGEHVVIVSLPDCGIVELVGVTVEQEEVSA